MSNKIKIKINPAAYTHGISILYDHIRQVSPALFNVSGKNYKSIDAIPEPDLDIFLGMVMGLQQALSDEKLRRNPDMMEDYASLESSYDEWAKRNGLPTNNPFNHE